MTLEGLRALVSARRNFATEHQLSQSDYDTLVESLRGTGLKRDPNLRKEHFLFEGFPIVRSWEP